MGLKSSHGGGSCALMVGVLMTILEQLAVVYS